jgi:hypothetical protein
VERSGERTIVGDVVLRPSTFAVLRAERAGFEREAWQFRRCRALVKR